MNNIVDKTYLALELTKIVKPDDNAKTIKTYNYFLNQLVELDGIEQVDELKKENQSLRNQIMKLKIEMTSEWEHNPKVRMIKKIVLDSKGDMEPRVFDSLIALLPTDEK